MELLSLTTTFMASYLSAFAEVLTHYEIPLFFAQNECEPCPGSQFTAVGAAWANIGYMTHSDMLHFVSETNFGLWACLLYAAAAIGALVGVAINSPPRTYMWFMLGPAMYSFLINTNQEVKGVDWTVAGRPQDMREVWRDAETGMQNTRLVLTRNKVTIDGENGPQGTYPVATAMLFLDELFSASTNLAVEWLGLYDEDGKGSSNSNLASREGNTSEGPWYILTDLKWGFVENIVGNTLRSAPLRDAFVTFIGSECGDAFKLAINDGSYAAASQSKGSVIPASVFQGSSQDYDGKTLPPPNYSRSVRKLGNISIPAPSGLIKVISDYGQRGAFSSFAPAYGPNSQAKNLIPSSNCLGYLITIINGFRWESGHAYHQLLRTAPRGLDLNQFLRTLYYGWNLRKEDGADVANAEERIAFTKMLILSYLIRNEIMYAPQITNTDLRNSPSDQAKNFSNTYVKTAGSKSKYGELYQWAVMMPHIQGILLYFLIVAYPFACMVMVIPGYWKAFFTWVSFFAWAKLWDVGFAMVYVLERSVWSMIGNHSNMGRISNMLIQTAQQTGGVGVDCDSTGAQLGRGILGALSGGLSGGLSGAASGFQGGYKPALLEADLSKICAIPRVCSVNGLEQNCGNPIDLADSKALRLFDSALIVGSGADLDLSNGYYIYIMAALYFAIPAITGQLVLGAKAGASSMVGTMIGGVAGEAGRAAMTGYQHGAVNALQTNAGSLGQAAFAKSMRKDQGGDQGSFAAQILGASQTGLEAEGNIPLAEGKNKQLGAIAALADTKRNDRRSAWAVNQAGIQVATSVAEAIDQNWGAGGAGGKGGGKGKFGHVMATAGAGANFANAVGQFNADHEAHKHAVAAQLGSLDNHYKVAGYQLQRAGAQASGQRLSQAAEFAAQTAAWEAKNAFASHASALGGIAGMNSGALSPGHKPQSIEGMAFAGQLNSWSNGKVDRRAQDAALFPLSFYPNMASKISQQEGEYGSQSAQPVWGDGYTAAQTVSQAAGATMKDGLDNVKSFGNPSETMQAQWDEVKGVFSQTD